MILLSGLSGLSDSADDGLTEQQEAAAEEAEYQAYLTSTANQPDSDAANVGTATTPAYLMQEGESGTSHTTSSPGAISSILSAFTPTPTAQAATAQSIATNPMLLLAAGVGVLALIFLLKD